MRYGRSVKEKLFSFISYCICFQSLPNHLHPNFLANKSLAPQSFATWFLNPEQYFSDISLPLTTLSPITRSKTPTRYLFLLWPISSLIAWSLPPNLFWSNLIPDFLLPTTRPVPDLLISHISLPDFLIPMISRSKTSTKSLIFCFCPWSSTSETKSYFRKIPLHLIEPWSILSPHQLPSPWYSAFTHLTTWLPDSHDRLLKKNHPVPNFLILSLVFCPWSILSPYHPPSPLYSDFTYLTS